MARSRIKGITVEIGGDTTGLEKALQSVNKSLRDTQSQLKDVERLLKLDPSNTELLSQKQKLLAQSISDTKQKLEALKTAQEQAKQQMESGDLGKDKYDALQREIVATEQELQKLVKEAADANTALTKIGEAGKTLESVGGKITSVGQSLTTHVTLPIVAAGTAIIKTAGDFDQSMAQVKAVTQATGDDFAKLRDLAIGLGAKTAYSAVEVADAMTEMAKAGWDTNQIMDGMAGVLDAAAASGEGLASVATIVADAVSGFGLEASDAARVADILAHAANAGTIDISDLGESFKYVAPMAQSMGLSIEDVSTALTAMSMAGIKGSQAGTSLRRMLTNLAKPTKSVQEAIDALGISITNSDGSFKSLDEIVAVLRDSFSGLTDEEKAYYAATLAGANGQSGLLALLNLSEEEYAALSEEMKNCRGEAEKTATTMQDNLNSKFEQLGGALESLAIKLGDILLPKLKSLVEWMTKVVEKFTNAPKSTQELILKIAGIAAAIGPALIALGKLTSGVGKGVQTFARFGTKISTLVAQTQAGTGPLVALKTAIAGISGPVLAVVAVIGVLVAAFVNLWKNNEEFRNKITATWDEIKSKVEEFGAGIKARFEEVGITFEGVTETLKKVWNGFCELLAPVFTGAFDMVKNALSTVLGVLTGLLDVFIGVFTGNWDKAWQGIKGIASSVWNGIKGAISTTLDTIKGVVNTFLGWFGTDWNTVWTTAKTKVTDIWNNIISKAGQFVQSIKDKWNELKQKTTEIFTNIGQSISTKWNEIKTGISDKVEAIKTNVAEKFEAMKTSVADKFTAIKDSVLEKFTAIKDGIKEKIDAAKEAVHNAIEKIKSFFSFNIELPHIPMPHFSIQPEGWKLSDLLQGVIPKLDIAWYRKAMNSGMILNSPTIFGMKDGQLLGAGEAGSETVVGTNSLMQMIRTAVEATAKSAHGDLNVYVNSYGTDAASIAQEIGTALQAKLRMAGTW